jgi:hypothetical protein
MPYQVRSTQGSLVQYLDKHGSWTPNATKARVYAGMGPLKNSLADAFEAGELKWVQVVEVELRETGHILPLEQVLAPLKEKRQAELDQRTSTQRLAERNKELAELERLKVKYER